MPGGWTTAEICNGYAYGVDTSNSRGTQITAGSSANSKGSWTQLVSATTADTYFISVFIDCNDSFGGSGTESPFLVDIGVGAAASEVTIIQNLYWANPDNGGRQTVSATVPIYIPSGTRLSARCQSNGAALQNWVYVSANGFDGGFKQNQSFSGVDSLSALSSASIGTALSGTTANTFGAWTQMTASTSRDYAGIFTLWSDCLQGGNQISFVYDVGIGGAGSEVVILPQLRLSGASLGTGCCGTFYPVPIPAGTRVAARYEGATSGGDPSIAPKVVVYGVY